MTMSLLGVRDSFDCQVEEFVPGEPIGEVAVPRDRINVGLGLVNWVLLMLLMCALLLAKTLPTATFDTLGGVASVTCSGKTCTKVPSAH
jgi:hypothetical protein